MKPRKGQKFLGLTLSLCMMGDPLQSAVAPMVPAGSESTALPASSEDFGATSGAPSYPPDALSPSKPPNLIMGGISLPKTPLTMDFQDADVRDVLHLLALKSGLNVIYGTDVTGPISVHLDRVPFDQAFQTVLTLKGLVALPMGPRVIRVVSSVALNAEQSQAATFTRVFRLNYALADDIKRPVDAIRGASGRKGVSSVDVKTNALIITDTQEGLKEAEDLIPVLDLKPAQVDIEAKIVEVSLDKNTELGISWSFAGTAGPRDSYKIGGVGTTGANASGTTPATGPGLGGIVQNPSGFAFGSGGAGVLFPASAGSAGLSFLTRQGTYALQAQISALATQNRAKVLSNPHIVTTNNTEATINVVDKIPYKLTTVSPTGTAESVQFVDSGVKLSVKPTVNADRRITLKVKPEVSNPSGTVGGVPQVKTRNAETTVILRDGETIAIGGLIAENTQKIVSGIPLLMSIPILGHLFKGTSDRKLRTELIVFLTPKIAAE